MSMRSTLGRVRGLGSAKEGPDHWWAQKMTSIALVPLCLWFVINAVALAGADHATFAAWLGEFYNGLLMILLVIALFHHAQLGVQVVIEDYVHNETAKISGLVVVKLLAFLCAVACIFAVVRVGMGG